MRLTKAEWRLMKALWGKHPATAREVSDALPRKTNWAYTTIKTMLSRLVAKGALKETKSGNVSVYEPVLSERKARLAAVRSLASDAFDGAFGSLVHFLVEEERLSPGERERLLDALEEESEKGKNDD